jgi:site-specific recombinase XerD
MTRRPGHQGQLTVQPLIANVGQMLLPLCDQAVPPAQWTAAGLLADWLATRASPATRDAYRRDIDCLGEFLEVDAATAAAMLLQGKAAAEQVLEHYSRWMTEVRGMAPMTRARRIWGCQSLVRHARRREVVTYHAECKVPKLIPRRDTRGPDHRAVDNVLLELACGDHPTAARDAALLACLYVLGLRAGECHTMRVRDCDIDSRTLWIVEKGRLSLVPRRRMDGTLANPAAIEPDREQLPGVPEAVWQLLSRYLAWLRGHRPDLQPDAPLWWATRGGIWRPICPLGKQGVRHIVRRLLREHRDHVTPHGLRHAAITKLLDLSAGNLRLAQMFARHADVRQLARYDDGRRGLFADAAGIVGDAIS